MDKRIHPQFRELVEQANKGEGKFGVMDTTSTDDVVYHGLVDWKAVGKAIDDIKIGELPWVKK